MRHCVVLDDLAHLEDQLKPYQPSTAATARLSSAFQPVHAAEFDRKRSMSGTLTAKCCGLVLVHRPLNKLNRWRTNERNQTRQPSCHGYKDL